MTKTDTTLHEFLAATKPGWCIPIDVLVTAQMISLRGSYPGHEQMTARCALSDTKAVYRSLKRLEAAQWITKDDSGSYTVNADKLPKGGN